MESASYLITIVQYVLIGIMLLVVVLLSGYAAFICITLFNRRQLKRRDMVWLELTPPASIAKTPEATVQLFSVVHGLRAARHIKDKLLGRTPVMSLEIVSTKCDGIRYLMQVEHNRSDNLQKAIVAYVPDAKVKVVDYDPREAGQVLEFKQDNHYVLPLTLTKGFEQHDPLSYVTAAMTKLSDNEQITMQLVIMPVKLNEAVRLSRRILGNEDILRRVQRGHFSGFSRVSEVFGSAMLGATDLVGEVYNGTTASYHADKSNKDAQFQAQVMKRQRPARTLSAFELELMESMHQKVTQPLFQVSLRIIVTSGQCKHHLATLRSALDSYSVPPYQALRAKTRLPLLKNYRAKLATQRLPNLFQKQSLILSAAELASLYHFPSSKISKTDNLVTSLSRTLPAPVSLKQNKIFDVV
ncbi:hypothetical protein KC973_00835, partial [Candidatus Saccharibacteria bacterium]|nr:hypothetical protein [Candidatus Saccharibacteria bacterium]